MLQLVSVDVGTRAVLEVNKVKEGKLVKEEHDVKWRNQPELTDAVKQLAAQVLAAAEVPEDAALTTTISFRFKKEGS